MKIRGEPTVANLPALIHTTKTRAGIKVRKERKKGITIETGGKSLV